MKHCLQLFCSGQLETLYEESRTVTSTNPQCTSSSDKAQQKSANIFGQTMISRKQSQDFWRPHTPLPPTHQKISRSVKSYTLPHLITSQLYPEQDHKSTSAQSHSACLKKLLNAFETSQRAKLLALRWLSRHVHRNSQEKSAPTTQKATEILNSTRLAA